MPEQKEMQVQITTQDLILIQLKDLKENIRDLRQEVRDTRKELNQRVDRLENRMDKLEEKMDKLSNRQDSTLNHGNIMTASVVGIALGVLYFVLTH